MKVLVLNAGSSSQKSCLYELTADPSTTKPLHPLWEAKIDWSHQAGTAEIKVESHGHQIARELPSEARSEVMAEMLNTLTQGETQVLDGWDQIAVVGHRVVHGGEQYRGATWVDPEVKQAIRQLFSLAPAHNPANLEGIEIIEKLIPNVPQVVVFDTAFHSQLPLGAAIYPGPYEWFEQGIRRYGFHGISHQYCAQQAARILDRDLNPLKLITCHLGNGASLAAIRDGHSVDTTMGFTPLEGLMMGTRSGSVDPGILFYLMRNQGLTADQVDQLLNRQSGLQGISGESGDMRRIQAAIESGHPRAKLAFEIYIHRLRSCMGSMLASLGGLDVIAFTGGIGENAPAVRAAACQGFEFLGVKLDLERNQQRPMDEDLATPESAVRVLVIHAEEDWAIAQACWRLSQG